MKKVIEIDIKNKIATAIGDDFIVCQNGDYQIKFNFDEEWDSHNVKTARLYYNFCKTDIVFEGNICDIPPLAETKSLIVGVFAGELETSTPAEIKCVNSIKKYGGNVHEPLKDVYGQIIDLLNEYISSSGGEISKEQVEQIIKESVDPKLENKLDKVEASGAVRFYGISRQGAQTVVFGADTDLTSQAGRVAMFASEANSGSKEPSAFLSARTPTKKYHCTPKKYVDDLIAKHLDEFHITQQWYENITIADMYGSFRAYVSATKLPNPTKIRIEDFDIGSSFIEDVGEYAEFYRFKTHQTFDITPDSNGNFSVVVNADRYSAWSYVEELEAWMPNNNGDELIEENVPLTLNFEFGYDRVLNPDDIAGDTIDATYILCNNVYSDDYCTVSLYI